MNTLQLPSPAYNAQAMTEISAAIVSDFLTCIIPGASTVAKLIELYTKSRLESAQKILIERIRQGEVNIEFDPEYENIIPNFFSYFHAAQEGETNRVLCILSDLLIGNSSTTNSDSGFIKRSSRRLAGMNQDDIAFLATIESVFEWKYPGKENNTYQFIDDSDVTSHRSRTYVAPEQSINSNLSDLASRGLLYLGGDPETIGGINYYRSTYFYEVIDSATKFSSIKI